MANILYDDSANLKILENKTIAVLGYGNQGRAHALNLRDSGLNVLVGARKNGVSFESSRDDGFKTLSLEEAAGQADLIMIGLPDERVAEIYKKSIKSVVSKRTTFVFAHGFAVHYKLLDLPEESDVILVAPTGPGHQVRELFKNGLGLPALVAVENDFSGKAKETCLAYARGIGATRAGVIETTFAEETIVDLFCEQSVLCGGIPELIKSSFSTLVDNGYQPELAYISCLKEVKLIADLLFERGLVGMRDAISNTAKYGAALSGPEIIDTRVESKLNLVLKRIEDGKFAQSFLNKSSSLLDEQKALEKSSKLNKTGVELSASLRF